MFIGLPYDMRKVVIDRNNIHKFLFSRFRRRTRPDQIKSILKALNAGLHFIGSWTVVEVEKGVYELIDGNHRLESIHRKLKENQDFSIEVELKVINDIKYPITAEKEEQMKDIYHRVGIPVRQSSADFIDAFGNVIPVFQPVVDMLKEYDAIYPFKQVPFHQIVGAYLAARSDGEYGGTPIIKPKELVDEARMMGVVDFRTIRDFYSDLYAMFRLDAWSDTKKPYCLKTTGFSILFYLWYHNKDRLGRKKLVNLFRSKITDIPLNYLEFVKIAKRPGVGQSKVGLTELVNILNKAVQRDDHKFRLS